MALTPPKPKDVLTDAAARLSRAAPKSWEEFTAALSEFARDRTDACVQAPSDRVLIAQGMARQCNELLALFIDAAKQK